MRRNPRKTRDILERWFITGTLELVTPTYLGNGDADSSVDLPLLTDPLTGRALLTGASLAGALRSYLQNYRVSQGQPRRNRWANRLFGGDHEDEKGLQSSLIVYDALGAERTPQIELRDGVAIDRQTRTAAAGLKYDMQLLAPGTTFTIGFELLLDEQMLNHETPIKQVLAAALLGLQSGDIHLGGRKRRGFGQVKVTGWQLWQYDLKTSQGLKGWLQHDHEGLPQQTPQTDDNILSLLQVDKETLQKQDQRHLFHLKARFAIDGSVLIRAGFEAERGPDFMHLESKRRQHETGSPVLSGTSLAGVIRAQAHRIADTVTTSLPQAKANRAAIDDLIAGLFGDMRRENKAIGQSARKIASRVTVKETVIRGGTSLVQSRVAIDRFTGGALESALFSEQPVFGGQATLELTLHRPQMAEIGLLLLVLKDLWTGFTPIGGEASVGRGRLQGQKATLTYRLPHKDPQRWELEVQQDKLVVAESPAHELEKFVAALIQMIRDGQPVAEANK